MITSVDIYNFKNIRNLRIELEPLTVFVGANGSGKTSALEAIDLAVDAAHSTPERVFAGERHCDWLYTRGGEGDLNDHVSEPGRRIHDHGSPYVARLISRWRLNSPTQNPSGIDHEQAIHGERRQTGAES
jgi:predicted ATPase